MNITEKHHEKGDEHNALRCLYISINNTIQI